MFAQRLSAWFPLLKFCYVAKLIFNCLACLPRMNFFEAYESLHVRRSSFFEVFYFCCIANGAKLRFACVSNGIIFFLKKRVNHKI